MDIASIVDFLDEDLDYGDGNKCGFIEGLRIKMEFFNLCKDTYFNYSNGRHGGSRGLDVVVFKGNYSTVEWSFRINIEDDKITSVYECGLFDEK